MHYSTTQAKLKALEDNGVAQCYYCDRVIPINPDLDVDVPQICDPCLESDYAQGRPQELSWTSVVA